MSNRNKTVRQAAILGATALLLAASSALAADDARFKGTGKADPVRVSNVTIKPTGVAGVSTITFDLAWDWSWRTAWDVDAAKTGGKDKLKLENWDAAWVFVKFHEPGAEGYSHAMLSTNKADYTIPSGAAMDLGLSSDGARGVGVFVYRKASGQGPNDWKGVSLPWLHPPALGSSGATGGATFDPAKVHVKIFAIQMVYVPQCAFWVGDGATNHIAGHFSAGMSDAPFRIVSEQALKIGGETADILNNHEAFGMASGRADDFNSDIPQVLPAAFPKGYQAFYCMRQEITQQQYTDFLNTISYSQQAACTRHKRVPDTGASDLKAGWWECRCEIRVAKKGVPNKTETVVVPRGSFLVSGNVKRPGVPAVYKTTLPHVACNFIMSHDYAAYTAWAGLRPMTELEFEKASRGPLLPVPNEFAWGTDAIAGMGPGDGGFTLRNPDTPEETMTWEGANGPDAVRGSAISEGNRKDGNGPVRAGIFATPESDRVRAGASYWGILDLTGSMAEQTVSVGVTAGRSFPGTHGDGGDSPWAGIACGTRGGGLPGTYGGHDSMIAHRNLFTSHRNDAANWTHTRYFGIGCRGVRTAPVIEK